MASLKDADLLEVGPGFVQRGLVEDGKYYVHHRFHDDASLARNQQLRNSRHIEKARLGLHDNEDIRGWLSVPTLKQWNLFCKAHPDIYSKLKSRLEHERMTAMSFIKRMHPEWVVQSRL